MSVRLCVWYKCVRRGTKYFKVVYDWVILLADLCGTILVGGSLWTQFDGVVVVVAEFLAVVFFAFLSRSVGVHVPTQHLI